MHFNAIDKYLIEHVKIFQERCLLGKIGSV
jgi:hypothetical protein